MFYPNQRPPNQPFPYYYYEQQPVRPQRNRTYMLKSAFIDESGQFDLGRTIQTVDQVVKTVHQMTPLIRQISQIVLKK